MNIPSEGRLCYCNKRISKIAMEFTETAFRPPQEANSLLLRLTQGCTYNACHFCYTSRGHDFLEASAEHLEGELLTKKSFHPADTNVYMIGATPWPCPLPG